MGRVINWELSKKLKFDHTKKWYMHNPDFILENETHKLLWGFDVETDLLISTRRPDLKIICQKSENLQNCELCCLRGLQSKIERMEKRDKYLDLARELKKLWNMKVSIIPFVSRGYLRRLAVSQTSKKNHQLIMM